MAEYFPERPILDTEVDYLKVLWGGDPIKDLAYIDGFIRMSADPLLYSSHLDFILPKVATASAEALDVDPATGVDVFTRAAKLYAGVIAELTPLDHIFYNEKIARTLGNVDERAFTWKMYERVNDEAASFCDIIAELRPVLGTNSDQNLHNLSLIGGGFMHSVIKAEIRDRKRRHEVEDLESQFPELADIAESFEQLDDN